MSIALVSFADLHISEVFDFPRRLEYVCTRGDQKVSKRSA